MMRLPVIFLILLAMVWVPSAKAQEPVLVELFASKNCKSCPTAYNTVRAIEAPDRDVLVLTWAVDYWDYLGGKEKMALPESKDRQRGYVERFALRGPYTPQAVLGGAEQAAANKPTRLAAAMERALSLPASTVVLTRKANKLTLEGKPEGLVDLWWVSYLSDKDNSTAMPHPVTSARQIGPWLGGRADIDLPACESACVLIVQEAGFGRILAISNTR